MEVDDNERIEQLNNLNMNVVELNKTKFNLT